MHKNLKRALSKSWLAIWLIAISYVFSAYNMSSAVPINTLIWERDLSRGLNLARTARKWVLVDVYTDWCGWCHKLDRDTYTNSTVIQFLSKSFILVKINGDDPQLGTYVKSRYGVKGYPTTMILAPNGALKGKFSGYLGPNAFVNRVTQFLVN